MVKASRKLSLYLFTLLMVLSLNFALVHLMPGGPLVHLLGEEGYARLTNDAAAAMREELGLDGSLAGQYGRYLAKMLTGNWGWSHRFGQPVRQVIGLRLQWTLTLLVPALLVSTLAGGWLGGRGRMAKKGSSLSVAEPFYALPLLASGLLYRPAGLGGGVPLGPLAIDQYGYPRGWNLGRIGAVAAALCRRGPAWDGLQDHDHASSGGP